MTQMLTNTTRRLHLLALGLYAALACLITWPLLTVLGTHFAGYAFGDAHEMTRHIWWFTEALRNGQPLIFQPLLGYPDGMQGVILWSDPLQFFPGWLLALFLPLPAAYNLQALLNLTLNGWAAYWLMWKLLTPVVLEARAETLLRPYQLNRLSTFAAALVAGVVFMAAPTIQGHLAGGHGGLLVQWPLPLLAWSLLRVTNLLPTSSNTTSNEKNSGEGLKPSPTQRTAASLLVTRYSLLINATFFFVLTPLGHTLQLIYTVLPLLGVIALTTLFRRDWRALARLALVVVIGSGLLALFLLPVFSATLDTSAYVDEGGGVAFSLDLLGVVTPSFNHPLFGQWDYTHRVLGVNIIEGSAYVGIIAAALGLLALWKSHAARWWLLPALVAWVLALGPLLKIFDAPVSLQNSSYTTFVTLPWALLGDLPVLSLARTPGRFGFLLALCVAVVAGYGTSVVLDARFKVPGFQRPVASDQLPATSPEYSSLIPHPSSLITRYSLLITILIALILFEYQSFMPLPTYPAAIPDAVRALAGRDDVRAVFDMPWDNLLAAKDGLWLQTAHEKPLIAGQVTRRTPVDPAKLTLLEHTLDPALLDAAGADILILHKHYDENGQIGARAQELFGAPFYEDERLALWERPAAVEDADFQAVTTLPRAVNERTDFHLYAPASGWVNFDYQLNVQVGRQVEFLLDGHSIYSLVADEAHPTGLLRLPVSTPGYHTLTLALNPPCPALLSAPCQLLEISRAEFEQFQPASFPESVTFDRGVTLLGWHINDEAFSNPSTEQQYINVTLWWRFDQPRSEQDVRFIHVLDGSGKSAGQFDQTLGPHAAVTDWVESLSIEIAGNDEPLTLCTGWYTYPDLIRFGVLSDVQGASDGLACIGEFMLAQ